MPSSRRTSRPRPIVLATAAVLFASIAAPARAQAPPAGPLALEVSPTPRTTAMGQAWVAGRDADVIFYNPAQIIGARASLDLSATRHGGTGSVTTLGSSHAAGKWSFTLGWGVVLADFDAQPGTTHPLTTDVLLATGPMSGSSRLLAAGGAITLKGWRLGATGKYAADLVTGPVEPAADARRSAWLLDVGGARSLFGGTIAVAVQDLASDQAPVKWRAGWSIGRAAGPIDLLVVSQLTHRDEWTAGAAGVEAAYSWIEGYTIALRAGVRRPETVREHPLAWGAAFTADRFTVEYARQTFDGRSSNGVTLRWR
jgi:hypothetical protein